jgi:2-oxo-3-hexenedioate decarboxylase
MSLTGLPAELLAAWDAGRSLPSPPSARAGGLTMPEAFAVAEAVHALRAARGERPRGFKIGFTNRSIWPRYGVHTPIWGPVWDTTAELLPGTEATLSLAGLVEPRLEPEVVFGLGAAPRAGMSPEALRGCIEWVAHGFEVVHTHCAGWRFTAADCIADFGLHGRLRIGPRVPAAGWANLGADLAALEVGLLQVEAGGAAIERDRGIASVVLDGPLTALATWIDALALHSPHWQPQAGDWVTTGTITDAWPLVPGQTWRTQLSGDTPAAQRLSPLVLHTTA